MRADTSTKADNYLPYVMQDNLFYTITVVSIVSIVLALVLVLVPVSVPVSIVVVVVVVPIVIYAYYPPGEQNLR